MYPLYTPFGEIEIKIDGDEIEYEALEGEKIESLCPNVLGRYQIEIEYFPDGKEHEISCVFLTDEKYNRTPESGENLECQSFYNEKRYKLSIGLIGERWGYIDGKLVENYWDYDIDYLKNGMSYLILKETTISKYIFGISWIDNVGWDDSIIDGEHNRDVETWFGADPTLAL